jgi:PKD repeat protein
LPKTALSTAAALVLLAIFASPALAAPDPAFTVAPSPPRCGDLATYTDASTVGALLTVTKVEWDFDNDNTFEESDDAAPFQATHRYGTRGTKTFGMKVTDSALPTPASTEEDQTVNVVTAAPTASFTASSGAPLVGSDVLFASDASDPDGDDIASYAWDFDGDGTTDSTARNPVHPFGSAGPKRVTLQVTDSCGAPSTKAAKTINVVAPTTPPGDPNTKPTARFAFTPDKDILTGTEVAFVSSSFDPDGSLREEAWDLDGDGQFDDGTGPRATFTYKKSGVKTVSLRATDSLGATAISQERFTVNKAPRKLKLMRPLPEIVFTGAAFRQGASLEHVGADGPRGALVTVRCKGKGCPVKERRKRIKKRSVRFANFERFLRSGTRVEIFVAQPGKLGFYRRYTIRAGKRPKKIRRCLDGMRPRPFKC